VPKRAATKYPTPVHAALALHSGQPSNRLRPATAPTSNAPRTSAGTALRYLAVLSRVFAVGVRKLRWLEASPTDGVERPAGGLVKVPRVLATAEESELLAQADASTNRALQHIVRIGLRTGMRMMEIMRMRWSDIELHEGYGFILIQKAKNNRQRRVPLVGDALESVLRLKTPLSEADLKSRLLFPSEKDKNRPVLIRAAWERCLADAKITNFRFHDLRHTFASRLAGQNYSLPRIAAVLGHVDLRSTQIYTHFAQDDAVAMVAATTVAATDALARLKKK
jgi:integrase